MAHGKHCHPRAAHLDILIAVLREEIKHGRCGLAKMILSRGDEDKHRCIDLFDELLAFTFDIVQFGVLLFDATLIGKDDQSVAVVVVFGELLWNCHVPPDPILVI